MPLLYQEINKVPGLTGGNAYQKQASLYNSLGGSGQYGTYRGDGNQNNWLLSQIKKNNYYLSGIPGSTPQVASTPAATPATNNTVQGIIGQYTGGQMQANPVTPFNEVLPYQQYLQGLNTRAIAEGRINPEEALNSRIERNQFDRNVAQRGGFRTGQSITDRNLLQASQGRRAAERIESFKSTLDDQLTSNYQTLADMYWKDPNLDVQQVITPFMTNINNLASQYAA